MSQTVAVITPAHKAESLIAEAVRSVLTQTHGDWEHWIISDDLVDYEALLRDQGLSDPRQRFLNSGMMAGGSTRARNIVLDQLNTPYAAILDADDRFKPRKLELSVAALAYHPLVSTALDVIDETYRHLRYVGDGPDALLASADYKFRSISMDSMLVWDRSVCDGRYDTELKNMTDLDFLMRLWRTTPASYYLGTPLHDYVKLPVSMSNGPGVTERMITAKTILIERLASGFYPMADPRAVEGISKFLRISLQAEAEFGDFLAAHPGAQFEDGLEPRLSPAPAGTP
jgi:glycosyltransferase involved in cell wall biosynthesis